MTIRTILGTGLALAATCVFAQTPPAAAVLSFEAASVKPAPPPAGRGIRVMMGGDPGRVNYSNVSLRELIRTAYQLKDYQISGPDWINSERFDIVAKLPEGAKESDKPAMMRTLLAERFKLTIHREKKELPAYALVVAKGGIKMKEFVEAPSDDAAARGGPDAIPSPPKMGPDGSFKMPAGGRGGMMMMNGMGRMQAQGVPIQNLTDFLSRTLDRPVLDETGLTAKYDISLNWTPEPGEGPMGMKMAMAPREGGAPPAGGGGGGPEAHPDIPVVSGPPLPIALQQQLGLKLEPKKLPLEMVVVDHIEKVPTDN